MTLKKVEYLFDCKVALRAYPGMVHAHVTEGGEWLKKSRTLGAAGRDDKDALSRLVALAYQEVSDFVMRRAQRRCERCGALGPLQTHHKVYRSHRGQHVPSNCEAACSKCHEKIHGPKR